MGLIDGFRNVLSRNTLQPTTTNSAYDISGLARDLRGAGFNITVGGRALKQDLDADQIEELYGGLAQAAIQLTAYKVAKLIEDNLATVSPDAPEEPLDGVKHPYMAAITSAPYSNRFFFQAIAEYVLAMGNAYVYKGETKREGGLYTLPKKFELFETHKLNKVYDRSTKKLVGYRYKKEGSDLNGDYLKENVLKIHNLNIFDLGEGRGLLSTIVRNLLIEDQATLLQYAQLINGTSIPGFITVDPDTPSDIFSNIQESVNQRWSGVKTDKSGAPVVIKGGKLDWQEINVQYDKLAMDKMRDSNDNVIRSRLGVSKTIMGQEESGVTRDTSETMTENFEDNTCMPLAQLIVDMFSQDYINTYPEAYGQQPVEFAVLVSERRSTDDELKEAETVKSKTEAANILIAAGFDAKAALEAVGLEDIKFNGLPTPAATPVTPANSIEIHNHKDNASDNGGDNEDVLNSFCESHGCHTNAFDPSTMTPDQTELAMSIAAIDEKLLPIYLASLDTDIPTSERKAFENELSNLLYGYSTATTATLAPLRYSEMLRKEGGLGAFKMTQKTFNELLDSASKAALSHLDTVDQNVKDIVAQVAKDELGEDVARQKVQEYFKNKLTQYESQRLAVDQSRRIYGEAKLLSDKQFLENNNLTAYKIFRNYGPNPCPYCQAAAGKKVPVDVNFYDLGDVITAHDNKGNVQAFQVGYAPVSSGKIHPFCSCDYELVIEDK